MYKIAAFSIGNGVGVFAIYALIYGITTAPTFFVEVLMAVLTTAVTWYGLLRRASSDNTEPEIISKTESGRRRLILLTGAHTDGNSGEENGSNMPPTAAPKCKDLETLRVGRARCGHNQ
jgi:hypothetical protein